MTSYDVIGDVHGCYDEMIDLIKKMGYILKDDLYVHPYDRKLVFLGDITDRGPNSIGVMEFVYHHVMAKCALYAPGNHCNKLYRYLRGHNVKVIHGLETTVAELNKLTDDKREEVVKHFKKLYESSRLYLILANGKLVVAHAGITEEYIGYYGKKVRQFVLYGDVTGEKNPDGTPVRLDWAKKYKGNAYIVYGHTPVIKPRVSNRTINIDTGCVFGGSLTSFRYPELKTVSVKSKMPYDKSRFKDLDDNIITI